MGTGFIAIHRQIQESPTWKSLRGEQRSVLMSLLLLANWKPCHFFVGKIRIDVGRGELAHSVESIAADAGVSPKVARTTIDNLLAWGFLTVKTGIVTGTRVRVLTIVNYSKFQALDFEEGTGTGKERAKSGHDTGTIINIGTKPTRKPTTSSPAAKDPRHQEFIDLFCVSFMATKGYAYKLAGRDFALLKTHLRDPAATLTEFQRRLDNAWPEPFFRNIRPTLTQLLDQWNIYGAAPASRYAAAPPAHKATAQPSSAEEHAKMEAPF